MMLLVWNHWGKRGRCTAIEQSVGTAIARRRNAKPMRKMQANIAQCQFFSTTRAARGKKCEGKILRAKLPRLRREYMKRYEFSPSYSQCDVVKVDGTWK